VDGGRGRRRGRGKERKREAILRAVVGAICVSCEMALQYVRQGQMHLSEIER